MNEKILEKDYEIAFKNYLKDLGSFLYIHNQFSINSQKWRIDVLCVDYNYDLWIFELKIKYHKSYFGQLTDYIKKIKPKYAVLVTPSPSPNLFQKEFGYWQFDAEHGVVYRMDGKEWYSRQIPLYLQLRMSEEYVNKQNNFMTNQWINYNRRFLADAGYTTKIHRKFFWKRGKELKEIHRIKKEKEEKNDFLKINLTLEEFIKKRKEKGEK